VVALVCLRAIHALQPPSAATPEPFACSAPGVMEELLAMAGLVGCERQSLPCTWFYPDTAAALRGLLSSGPAVIAIGHSGEDAVREAVLEAIRPFRVPGGIYLLHNTFHCLIGIR
jgi:hypothetical protein